MPIPFRYPIEALSIPFRYRERREQNREQNRQRHSESERQRNTESASFRSDGVGSMLQGLWKGEGCSIFAPRCKTWAAAR